MNATTIPAGTALPNGLVKHSQRTARKPCRTCRATGLYWAHDPNGEGDFCEKCSVSGKWVMINTDGTRHSHGDTSDAITAAVSDKDDSVTVTDDPEPAPVTVDAPKPVSAAEVAPVAAPASTDPAFAAFQALVSSMRPSLDPEQIRDLVKAEFQATVFPTRTVVQRPDGTVKPVEGTTHRKVADVITDLMAGEHVMMVGPAGTGKSTIAEQAAEALGLEYGSISLSPMTPASQILGYMQAEGNYVRTLFRERYEHGGVFHFDEIDNGHPSTLAVINAALANGMMAFPDSMVKRHADFRCVASANTYGKGADRAYVGRQQIDAATLDRFTIETIEIDESLETELAMATGAKPEDVTRVLTTVRQYRANAAAKQMTVVLSPRASVGMCRLLAAGRSWDEALEARVRRGMSDADWSKLTLSNSSSKPW